MRNKIYRYTVVKDGVVCINKRSHELPSLRSTCHQIKCEASSIFYGENHLTLLVKDLHFRPGPEHWVTKIQRSKVVTLTHGSKDWTNLLLWLKRFHVRQGKRNDERKSSPAVH